MLKKIVLISGVVLTAVVCWFALRNYRDASAIAEENLRGVALSITAAVENIAYKDPSLQSLEGFRPSDLAFLALTDQHGIYRFHSNPDLIGTPVTGQHQPQAEPETGERRLLLGTGENAYEYITQIHLPDRQGPLTLHLILHTYRADTVIRKARLNMAILFCLMAASWILSVVIYRFALRDARHHREMARREELARLGELGAMLAHEIRNPLAGIKGFAQVIGNKPTDERNSGFAEMIVAETLRLEGLVTDLLTYARSSELTLSRFDLGELLAGTISLVQPEAAAKGISLQVRCPDQLMMNGDRDRLGQVLLNLVQNGVQAVAEGGTVKLRASAGSKVLTITIADNGAGIDREVRERIFEPFVTTKARGTGLGLAICKKIVEEHGGTIGLDNEAGGGTRFTITLPATMAG